MSLISKINTPIEIGKYVITQQFKSRKGVVQHNGLDISTNSNNYDLHIFSVAKKEAKVISVGFDANGYGNYVILDHNDGMYSLYGHLSVVSVAQNQIISENSQIGVMGSTGKSTGPHLHLEYFTKDISINTDKFNYSILSKNLDTIKGPVTVVDPFYFFEHNFDTESQDVEPTDEEILGEKENIVTNHNIGNYINFKWSVSSYTIDSEGKQIRDYKQNTLQNFIDEFHINITDTDALLNSNSKSGSFTLSDFLNFQGNSEQDTGGGNNNLISNAERITLQYDREAENEIGGIDRIRLLPANKIFIAEGTELRVPVGRVKSTVREPKPATNLQVDETDVYLSYDKEVSNLLKNPNYKIVNREDFVDSENSKYGTTEKDIPLASVWMWCRRLGNGGALIDLSPYITSLSTSVAERGGNFQLQLLPIESESICANLSIYNTNIWAQKGVQRFFENETNSGKQEFLAKANINKTSNEDRRNNKRSDFYFHYIIGAQDVVFIKFEPLEIDNIYSKSTNQIQEQGEYTRVTETIKRRDTRTKNGYEWDGGVIDKNELHNQVFDMIGLVDSNTITTNAPNDVSITILGRDLSKLFIEDQHLYFNNSQFVRDSTVSSEVTRQENSGAVASIKGVSFQLSTYLYYRIDKMMNYFLSALQSTQIVPNDFFSSYGDERTFRLTKPENPNLEISDKNPKLAVTDRELEASTEAKNVNGKIVTQFDASKFTKELCPGIWQIVKVFYDPKIQHRHLVDNSLQTDTGSIVKFLDKLCQKPFVELMFDTWGDKFYVHVKQLPFDYAGYNALRKNALEIKNKDVISEVLAFDDSEVITSLQILPQGSINGSPAVNINDTVPALIFEDYEKVYGRKFWQIRSNYVGYQSNLTTEEEKKAAKEDLLALTKADLAYLVESTMYNPFVRKGVIVVKGNRLYKRGQAIKYLPTGEIYHIESVVQSYSSNGPDRTTELRVTHGMVDKYFEKYFNIVNIGRKKTPIVKSKNQSKLDITLDINFEYDCEFGVNSHFNGTTVKYPADGIQGSPSHNKQADQWKFVNDEIAKYLSSEKDGLRKRQEMEAKNKSEILKVANKLKENPTLKLVITGHTDSDGSSDYNMQLSKRRALWVCLQITNYVCGDNPKETTRFASTGDIEVPSLAYRYNRPLSGKILERLEFVGAGETQPFNAISAANATASQKQLNRRVTATGSIETEVVSGGVETTEYTWQINRENFDFLLHNKQFNDCVDIPIPQRSNIPYNDSDFSRERRNSV